MSGLQTKIVQPRKWFSRVELHVVPEDRDSLRAEGLCSYESFMHSHCGQPISDQSTRQVRRIQWPGGRAYLKRAWGEKKIKLLSTWLLGHRPESAPVREYLMLKRLREAGLPAARPVAWGQKRVLGVPVEGFLLTEAVEGQPFEQLLLNSEGEARLRWIEAMGSLLGRLHTTGFFHILRVKDLIATPEGRLVMIDREVAHPWPRRFSPARCQQGLARCAAKYIRSGHRMTRAELLALTWAYMKELRPAWNGDADELRHGVEDRLGPIMNQPRYQARKPSNGLDP